MKNSVSNSPLSVQNGNIHIGDKVILALDGIESYKNISEEIESVSDKIREKSEEYKIKSDRLKAEPENKDLMELCSYLGANLLELEDKHKKLSKEQNRYVDNLLSALNICMSSNLKDNPLAKIEILLEGGKIDLVNKELDYSEMIKARDALNLASKNIESEIKLVSKKLLIKGKTTLLETGSPNKIDDAYRCFKESINTNRNYENVLEFCNFLYEYEINVQECIYEYKNLLIEFKVDISEKEEAFIDSKLAHLQAVNRDIYDAIDNQLKAIDIFESLINKSAVKDLKMISDLATNYSIIGSLYIQSTDLIKSEEYFDKALKEYKILNKYTDSFLSDYAQVLHNYIGLLIVTRDKSKISLAFEYAKEIIRISNKGQHSEDYKIKLMEALYPISELQTRTGYLDAAHHNLLHIQRIYNSLENKTTNTCISLMALVKYTTSNLFYIKNDLQQSCFELLHAISFIRMKLNIAPLESREMIAGFYSGLANNYLKQKKLEQYFLYKRQALNYLSEMHKINPNVNFDNIIGLYEDLILTHYSDIYADENEQYIRDLIAFYESCKSRNLNIDKLDILIGKSKNMLGILNRFYKRDDNKAKQIFINVINEIGVNNLSEKTIDKNKVINLAVEHLNQMGVYEILVNGRNCRIGPPNDVK